MYTLPFRCQPRLRTRLRDQHGGGFCEWDRRARPGAAPRIYTRVDVDDSVGSHAFDTNEFLVPDLKFAVLPLPAPLQGSTAQKLDDSGERLLVRYAPSNHPPTLSVPQLVNLATGRMTVIPVSAV